MKKLLITLSICLYSVCCFSQQKIYSDTIYTNGQIIINNYIVNDNNEKVNIAEPVCYALTTWLIMHPWFDYRYPHYGYYHRPIHKPRYVPMYRKPIYMPNHNRVIHKKTYQPVRKNQHIRRTQTHRR